MSLERGLELIREGAYFEAHEELEDEWRVAPAAERDFLQGLVHVSVAWLHAERGNRPGCERQLAKAARRLEAYRPEHRGVDVRSCWTTWLLPRHESPAARSSCPGPRV